MSAQTWGLKRADGRGRVVHIAADSQARFHCWESRPATTLCGQGGVWTQGDDMDGPPCVKCNRAKRSPSETGKDER